MSATMQNYRKAAELFEEVSLQFLCLTVHVLYVLPTIQIGTNSLSNTLLKYAAKDYFFKASLCNFCISPGSARVSNGVWCVCV